MDVVIFADGDDAGVARFAEHLRRHHDVAWWQFGVPEADSVVDVAPDQVLLEQPGVRLTRAEFASASIVVYRRRFHYDRPLVRSSLSGWAEQGFSEREWASLLLGVLLSEERRSEAAWVNSVRATLSGNNKLSLMLDAVEAGFDVPPFRVAAPVRLPEAPDDGPLVMKAVSADERIDERRYLTTTVIDSAEAARMRSRRVTTPVLLQHAVASVRELRVFYMLGSVVALELERVPDQIDIRYTTQEEMAPRMTGVEPSLIEQIRDYASRHGMHFLAMDFLVDEGGALRLIDVTPNGSWDYFETDASPFVSAALAGAVSSYLSSLSL